MMFCHKKYIAVQHIYLSNVNLRRCYNETEHADDEIIHSFAWLEKIKDCVYGKW